MSLNKEDVFVYVMLVVLFVATGVVTTGTLFLFGFIKTLWWPLLITTVCSFVVFMIWFVIMCMTTSGDSFDC